MGEEGSDRTDRARPRVASVNDEPSFSLGPAAEALSRARASAALARHPHFGARDLVTIASHADPRVPLVFNAPHSGRDYPEAFRAASRLDAVQLRRSEDAHVDALFAGVVGLGAPLIVAHFPRAWLDVNREPYELDPRMFDGALPSHANVRSVRVAGGLGTVPRLVAEGRDIYRRRLPVAEALERVERVYKPYHEALRALMSGAHDAFGHAVLIDCHSMPSVVRDGDGGARPDIVVGDRFGTSASRALTDLALGLLRERGFQVTRNKPYAGGFITEHYGRPLRGLHALQIEINRALYMDENSYEPTVGFAALAEELTAFAADLMARAEIALGAYGARPAGGFRHAAE